MLSLLKKLWSSSLPDPEMLDHVPVSGANNHRKKLKAAARKYGKPFKCSGSGIPHEIIPSKAQRNADVLPMRKAK